jgi:ribose transport system ATP-binding protein
MVTEGDKSTPLDVRNVSKTFGSTTVLRNADLRIGPGEVHALVGANGAGKSTLVRCITGVYPPDEGGTIAVDATPAPDNYTPLVAMRMGVRVVHQEAPIVDSLTLAEVAGLQRGFPKLPGGLINWRKLRSETGETLERLGIALSPNTHGGRLLPGERAMVMLALALADVENGARLLVLDEPTASLPASDAERFLKAVAVASSHGLGTLLVTHRLAEVFAISDRVTVIRDGRVVLATDTKAVRHENLVREIVGTESRLADSAGDGARAVRHSPRFEPRSMRRKHGEPLLEVEGLCGVRIADVSFNLGAGELLGVTGIIGSGAGEIGRLIAGVSRRSAGSVHVDGAPVPPSAGPRQTLQLGVAYVPADRLHEGGIQALSVRENVALPSYGEYWLKRDRERQDVAEVITVLDVRPPLPGKLFQQFSGGNQQKAIIGKWALLRPKLLVLDDPTTGVDPGAREELFAVLRGLLEAGTAILFISSEPEQLASLTRRVLVLRNGRLSAELLGDDVTEEAMVGASV